jgi:hypothetical protein
LAEWPKKKGRKQTHNGALALPAKVIIRDNVLAAVPTVRVFDAYCGPVGEMHARVWRKAADYVGVDTAWRREDVRRRYVADAALVMRAVDLSHWNVFDIDAFGSPWDLAIILAARRRWAPGELGALVLTDGSDGKMRFGGFNAMAELVGPAYSKHVRGDLQKSALRAWLERAGVVPEHMWNAQGYSGQVGSILMNYTAVVFRGRA